jgi:hypothetical protein
VNVGITSAAVGQRLRRLLESIQEINRMLAEKEERLKKAEAERG